MKKAEWVLILKSICAPILFEMCGIIPILLVMLGLINISAGITLRNILVYQYTYIFLVLAAGLFIYSVYMFLRQKNACNIKGLKQNKNAIILSLIMMTAFEAILLVAIQGVEKLVYGLSPTLLTDFIPIGIFLISLVILFNLYSNNSDKIKL